MTAPALNGNDKAASRELDGVRSEEVAQAGVPAESPGTHAPNEEGQAFSTKSPSLGPSDEMTRNAKIATEKEHQMSLLQGIKLYPKAVAWSMLISTCIVMEGYDVCLSSNFYAFPAFNKTFGVSNRKGEYEVPAPWQAGSSNGANCGEIIGLFINGFVSERFGYRYTVMASSAALTALIAMFWTATSLPQLQVAEVSCGIPWGIFQTSCITYASEVCPVALRGYLTCYVNFCWGLGQVIGIGVIKSQLYRGPDDNLAWKLPYASQWMWPVPLSIGVALAPESPWWLVRRGRYAEAKKNLLRSTSSNRETDFDADETIDMMRHTTELEREITSGASYLDCFKGVDRRRTEIVCMVWAIQNSAGNSFSGYSSYFLTKAGVPGDKAYDFAMGQYAINCVGVFGAWALMAWGIGRRNSFSYGSCGSCVTSFVMGFLGLVPEAHRNQGAMATGSMMIIWAAFYQLTVGTVAYSLVAELSTRRSQIKTVVLGRNLYIVVGIVCSVLTPYMLNTDKWDWGNFAGFFWGGSCFLCIIYCYFRIPEPAGRSFAEIDILFERGVSARKFASTKVDPFEVESHEKAEAQHVERINEKGATTATVMSAESA